MALIDQERLRTAVIGCGTVGTRRAAETSLHSRTRLLLCIDTSHAPARNTAERYGAAWSTDWRIAVDDERIDVVVICTPRESAYDIAAAALQSGKHVMMEKPMGCELGQAEALAAIAQRSIGLLKVGFNHRFHPAVARAYEFVQMGEIGDLVSMWVRDDRMRAADLIAWFFGMPKLARAEDAGLQSLHVEGNATVCARTAPNGSFLEICGREGVVAIDGFGDTPGAELLTVARSNAGGEPLDVRKTPFDGPDRSWAIEWHQFVDAMEQGTPYWGAPGDGLAAMRIVDALYRSARDGALVAV